MTYPRRPPRSRDTDAVFFGGSAPLRIALLERRVEIAKWRKNVRPSDDADDQRALTVIQLAHGFAKISFRRLANPIGTGAKVNAVEVMREDLVLGIACLDAQGQRDFEKFPMQ